jgi:hypothetical protein
VELNKRKMSISIPILTARTRNDEKNSTVQSSDLRVRIKVLLRKKVNNDGEDRAFHNAYFRLELLTPCFPMLKVVQFNS